MQVPIERCSCKCSASAFPPATHVCRFPAAHRVGSDLRQRVQPLQDTHARRHTGPATRGPLPTSLHRRHRAAEVQASPGVAVVTRPCRETVALGNRAQLQTQPTVRPALRARRKACHPSRPARPCDAHGIPRGEHRSPPGVRAFPFHREGERHAHPLCSVRSARRALAGLRAAGRRRSTPDACGSHGQGGRAVAVANAACGFGASVCQSRLGRGLMDCGGHLALAGCRCRSATCRARHPACVPCGITTPAKGAVPLPRTASRRTHGETVCPDPHRADR